MIPFAEKIVQLCKLVMCCYQLLSVGPIHIFKNLDKNLDQFYRNRT